MRINENKENKGLNSGKAESRKEQNKRMSKRDTHSFPFPLYTSVVSILLDALSPNFASP